MVGEAHKVDVIIQTHDQSSMVLNKVAGRFGTTAKAGMAMGVAMAGVTMAIGAAMQAVQALQQWIGESIKKYREFEKAIAEVNTMLDLQDKKYLADITKSIEGLSIAMGKSAIDLSRGMYEILSAGIAASEAMGVLRSSTKLAAATLSTVEESADAVTTILNAYSMSARQSSYVTDILARTVVEGKLRLTELANALGYVVTIAAQAGISIEAVAASVATLTKQGLSAQKATRALRQVINQLIAPSEESQSAMVDMGIAYDDLVVEAIGVEGVMSMINDATGGQIGLVSSLIPNVQALAGAMGLMTNSGSLLDNTLASITDSMGELNRMYNDATDNTQFLKDQQTQLGEAADRGAGKSAEGFDRMMDSMYTGMKSFISHGGDIGEAWDSIAGNINDALEEQNQAFSETKVSDYAAQFERLSSYIADQTALVTKLTARQAQYKDELENVLKPQRDIMESTHKYKEALRYIPMALEDSSYASKIFDTTTVQVINRIRQSKKEIDDLTEANDAYSRAVTVNSVAAMKIQLAAMGNRRGLNRSQKKQLKELEKADLENRIKQTENQIAITDVKKGALAEDEANLDRIRMRYNEEIYIINDTYTRDMAAMDRRITYKEQLIEDYSGYIDKANENILSAETLFQTDLNKIMQDPDWLETEKITLGLSLQQFMSNNQHKIFNAEITQRRINSIMGGGGSVSTPPVPSISTMFGGGIAGQLADTLAGGTGGVFAGAAGYGIGVLKNLFGLQSGTPYVPRTGLYQLHEGERVVPKHQNTGGGGMGGNIHIDPITVNANITSEVDLDTLGDKLGRLIASGIVSGVTNEYEVG